jgi:CBS domain-containing protein
MLVRDLMTPDPVTVNPDTHVKEALSRLVRHSITSMPVVDDQGRLSGIVSEADLICELVQPDPRALERPGEGDPFPPRTVEDLYSRPAASVSINEDVADAVETMVTISAKSLPVLDARGRLVGILSRSDIVKALARTDDMIAAEIDDLLRSLEIDDWLVEVEEGVVSISGPVGASQRALANAIAHTVAGVVLVQLD